MARAKAAAGDCGVVIQGAYTARRALGAGCWLLAVAGTHVAKLSRPWC